MENFDPFPVINGAVACEVVRGGAYRWNSLRRGESPQIILQRTLAGEGRVRLGKTVHRVGEGGVMIVAVPEDAEYWFDTEAAREWSFQWINLGGAWVRQIWLELRSRFGGVARITPRGGAVRAFSDLVSDFEANRLQDKLVRAAACHAVFLQFWLELEGGEPSPSGGHEALARKIEHRFREPVNIKELCADIGQSREHLSRVFRQARGIEPAAYMRTLRLEAARTYLRHGALGLDEIARRVGFGSGRQLARAFHAAYKMTPTEFREKQRPAYPLSP